MDRQTHRRAPHRAAALALGATLAASLAFVPALGTTTDRPGPPTGSAPTSGDLVLTVDGGDRGLAGDLVERRAGPRPSAAVQDLAPWVAASARRVAALGLPTVTLACDEGCDDEGGVEEHLGAGPIGDLDGDGHEEVLAERFILAEDGSSTNATEIRSGATGALLWQVVEAESFGFTVGVPDVGGGDGADVMRITYAAEDDGFAEDCTPVRCSFTESVEGLATLVLFDGATGAELRRSTHPYTLDVAAGTTEVGGADQPGAFAFDDHVHFVDDLYWLAFVDRDADGRHELLTTAVDVRIQQALGFAWADGGLTYGDVFTGGAAQVARTTTRLVDAARGSVVTVHDSTEDGRWSYATALAPGDGVLLESYPSALGGAVLCGWTDRTASTCLGTPAVGAPGAVLRSLDADLDERWAVPSDPDALFTYPAGADLDADGAADLLEVRIDPDTFVFATAMRSGASGAEAWLSQAALLAPRDGRLVGATFVESVTEETWTMDAVALHVDPVTGATTASRVVDGLVFGDGDGAVVGFLGIGLAPVVGADADVVSDVYYERWEGTGEEVCETYEDPDTGETWEECHEEYVPVEAFARFRAAEGTDLAQVAEVDTLTQWIVGLADLDGDGTAELLALTFSPEGEQVRALDLHGDVLWATTGPEAVHGLAAAPGGADVITVEGSTLRLRDGADLLLRWVA